MSAAPRQHDSTRPAESPLRRPHLVETTTGSAPPTTDQDRSIGYIIQQTRNLSDQQMVEIVERQRAKGIRFGEAAVELGYASNADVVFALSQQFHYPYTHDAQSSLSKELVTAQQPFSPQSEAFRAARSQLMMRVFSSTAGGRRALAVTSAANGDGKTFFAANLAVVMSQIGGRTLLVDANMRAPRLHTIFGLPNQSGLSGILSGRQEDNVIFQAPDLPSLFIMPVGVTPPNPLELIERAAFRLLMTELLRKFDHVIVDTPAYNTGTDAAVIAAKCGASVVIVKKDHSVIQQVDSLIKSIQAGGAQMAGVLYNEY